MRKVERLVNLIALLLDTRRPLTLDQVAELVPGYDASGGSLRRMFGRGKGEVRGVGGPVERAPIDAWGSEEGYFIDPEAYGMPELDLAPDERAALALAARAWSGATRDPAGGARPAALRATVGGAAPLLAVLLEATSGRKRVIFSYRPPGRDTAERRLDPYALVNRRGTWYVGGHAADRDALRSFRVWRIASDIRKARPTSRGADFEVPAGFDPGKVLPTAGEPEGAPMALVRGARATARLAPLRRAVATGPPGPDGLGTLRLPEGDRDGLLGGALVNGVEIVEPSDLRTEARRRLQALASMVE